MGQSIHTHRYLITIEFARSRPLNEHVKTLREAQSYKDIIDDTVTKAEVYDRVTGKLVEKWK